MRTNRDRLQIPFPGLLSAAAVPIAGASAGFFAWFLSVPRRSFHSYLFHNNLTVAERGRLEFLLAAGAVLFLGAWLLPVVMCRRQRLDRADRLRFRALLFSIGLPIGFLPFFAVSAFEVFHFFRLVVLICGFIATLIVILHFWGRWRQEPVHRSGPARVVEARLGWLLLLVFTLAYALFFVIWSLGRHYSFHSYAFDLGWQQQAFYTLLHRGYPRITLYVTLNHLGNHFQPLYYLLAPIYALYQDAATLLVLQTILLAAAAIPLYLIARRRLADPLTALVPVLVYLLYPALHGINNFDFHGLALLIPFVFCLLYALESERYGWFWIFFLLALITREDTAISLSGVGLYLLLDRRRRRLGLLVLGICGLYFIFVLKMMSALDGYADMQNYAALDLPERQSFAGVLTTVLTNPQYVFQHVFFNPDKIEYLLQILLPVVFLPLLSGRRSLMVVPGLAIMLLSNTHFNYWICCPYSAHIIPYVFFLTILGMERIRRKRADLPRIAIVVPLLVAGLLMNHQFGLVFSKRFPGFLKPTDRQGTAYSFFPLIPEEASLTTTRRLAPHLAARSQIHLLQAYHPDTDYILIDLDLPEPAIDTHEHWYQAQDPDHLRARGYVLSRLDGGEYGVVRFQDRFILLERGFDTSGNAAAAAKIRAFTFQDKPTILPYFNDPAGDTNPPRFSQADLLQAFLEDHSRETVLLAAKGDAAAELSYLCTKYMMMHASRIHTLDRGGSYLAVVRDGRFVVESIDNDKPVVLESSGSPLLRSLFPDRSFSLYSSGCADQGRASIVIDGRECSSNRAGMNVVVLDRDGRVIEQKVFETGKPRTKEGRR